jgi:Mlc titration factor MtfA (ptsG expression regulator)
VTPKEPLSDDSKKILSLKVPFYEKLSASDKEEFAYRINEFLLNVVISGIVTTIDETDRLLIAASAIIPIFHFKDWRYTNIDEILVYPNAFDSDFQTKGKNRSILGMVGEGPMEGKMILSKNALHQGFSNETDKKNTAIHEFVHLIDKTDGLTDGIPNLLLDKQYILPWLDLIHRKMEDIKNKKSDINRYGSTNQTEFFAVASEYFFERPELLKTKHPELYNSLSLIFTQKDEPS